MKEPRVSVLMAAYNVETFIDQAVQSVLDQTYLDWELIVVDDGSTDHTYDHLQKWAAREDRIRLFSNERNLGLGATRQKTLQLAQGVYAAVLDADDAALPGWLAALLDIIENNPEAVLVSCSRIIMNKDGQRQKVTSEGASHELLRWKLLFGNPINQPGCMVRIEAARRAGGYSDDAYLEDWRLFANLSRTGQVIQLDAPLMKYRVHPSSASQKLGPDRNRLEPTAAQIMRDAVEAATGLIVPGDLAWYLFRGRYVFRGDRRQCQRALDFVLQTYRAFVHRFAPPSKIMGAAVVDDAANVLRCGGWSLRQVGKTLYVVVSHTGIGCFWTPAFWMAATKLLLIPLTAAKRRGPCNT